MKTLKAFFASVLASLHFSWRVIRYVLIFVSAFFRQRASLACELVAIRSQLAVYQESIRQKRQPRLRFNPAFRLLWVLLSRVWGGWKSATDLMKPKTGQSPSGDLGEQGPEGTFPYRHRQPFLLRRRVEAYRQFYCWRSLDPGEAPRPGSYLDLRKAG
jgi:hypothetical protein